MVPALSNPAPNFASVRKSVSSERSKKRNGKKFHDISMLLSSDDDDLLPGSINRECGDRLTSPASFSPKCEYFETKL
jgi:hypothetical protein